MQCPSTDSTTASGRHTPESIPANSAIDKLTQAYQLKHPDATEVDILKAVRKELNHQQAQINQEYT
jgi:hypothetical protein